MITTTDPIADMLTRIRNAILVRKNEVVMPHSKIKEAIATLLIENGYVNSLHVEKAPIGNTLILTINSSDQNARITEITRLSKPGRRHYTGAKEIPKVKNGRGIVIISTSKGVMTGDKARQLSVGGELICKVY